METKQCKTCLITKPLDQFSSGKHECKICRANSMRSKRYVEKINNNLKEKDVSDALQNSSSTQLEQSLLFLKSKINILHELLETELKPSDEFVDVIRSRMTDLIKVFDAIEHERYSLYFHITIDPRTNMYISRMQDSKYSRIRAGVYLGDKKNHETIKQMFGFTQEDIQQCTDDMVDIEEFVNAIGNGYTAIYMRHRDHKGGNWASKALDEFTDIPVYDENTSTIIIRNPLNLTLNEYLKEAKIDDQCFNGLIKAFEISFERLEKKLIRA